MANRLHLNFSLETLEERISFLNEYFQRSEFERKPLSHDELETCANYVLWGKDKDGLNFVQKKEMEIETRNKTWTKREDESLEGLLETPGFNENSISSPNGIHKRVPREVFSRAEVRRCAPPYLIEVFEDLWRQIDTLDLIINYYDFEHNKRKILLEKNLPEDLVRKSKKNYTNNQLTSISINT